eukprot:scaffold58287_cov36-Phaeocystis_antarctica.AAC.1
MQPVAAGSTQHILAAMAPIAHVHQPQLAREMIHARRIHVHCNGGTIGRIGNGWLQRLRSSSCTAGGGARCRAETA